MMHRILGKKIWYLKCGNMTANHMGKYMRQVEVQQYVYTA